jgi:dsDNA-binding SOS-regulon protein
MAVIVKYVVVRDGKEDMIFTTKKEADAYDKMLDIAEQLHAFMQTSEIDIAVEQLDDLTFFMAQHRDQIGSILKGVAPDVAKKTRTPKEQAEAPAMVETEIEEPTDATVEAQAPEASPVSRSSRSKVAA